MVPPYRKFLPQRREGAKVGRRIIFASLMLFNHLSANFFKRSEVDNLIQSEHRRWFCRRAESGSMWTFSPASLAAPSLLKDFASDA